LYRPCKTAANAKNQADAKGPVVVGETDEERGYDGHAGGSDEHENCEARKPFERYMKRAVTLGTGKRSKRAGP
jgi:hypothetical protein